MSVMAPKAADVGVPDAKESALWCFGRESVVQAIEAMRLGKPIVVVDDENRENEGDLLLAADSATKENIAFMIKYTSGVICVSMDGDRLEQLSLPQMVAKNEDAKCTAFAVSVDYRHGTSTGISASDRAATIRALADSKSTAQDFSRPGHIFPLRAVPGGVLKRDGHTEAAVDFARLAGHAPVGVLCEIVTDDATEMMRVPQLQEFSKKHGLVLTSIHDLILYRKETGL